MLFGEYMYIASLGLYLRVELLLITGYLLIWPSLTYCQRVSKVVVSICTPTSNVWEFYFLHSYCTRYGNVFEAILPVVSQLVVVHLLSRVWFFVTPWTAALHAPLSSTISQSLLRFMSIELVMVYNRLSMSIWYSIFPLRLMMLNIFSYVYWKSLFS